MLALSATLCIAVFSVCFAIGRKERPPGTPREQSASIQVDSQGAAVPQILTSVPSLEITIQPSAPESAPTSARRTAAPEHVVAPSATPAAPVPQPPPAPVSRPTPAPAHAPSTHTQPSTGGATSSGGGSSNGAGKSQPGGSISFENSG
jgi:hypothetical protein